MSKWNFTKLVKRRISVAAFEFLIKEKNKQEKIKDIQYSELKLPNHLMEGNKNIDTFKIYFQSKGKTLDIKGRKRWKYTDKLGSVCGVREETGSEILSCYFFGDEIFEKPLHYDMFYGEKTSDMIIVANTMMKKLKKRETILDNG